MLEPFEHRGHAVWFPAARRAELRSERVSRPGPTEVTVRATVSLVSPGTELLVYRGRIDPNTELGLETCEGSFGFPVKYGYQVVGEVVAAGSRVPLALSQPVFARHPHQDLFTFRYDPNLVSALPDGLNPDTASFSNLMSVAVSALLDVPVRIGDRVAVFGQGPIGLFCAVLAAKTASRVWLIEPSAGRRRRAVALTGGTGLDPDDAIPAILDATGGAGVDVAFEASGAPGALQQALGVLGQEGTLGVVSYYGDQEVRLRLSPEFHFKRHHIVSLQAGVISAGLAPRWNRMRRLQSAWSVLEELPISELVTHRVPFASAPAAYELLDQETDDAFGVILEYPLLPTT